MHEVAGLEWDALERVRRSRDRRFDGKFFIAVRSTRIFCRPICPSPTSKPQNVRYFATATEATEAGYRPCLRCRPEAAPGSPAWLGTSAVVRRALRLIRDGALDNGSVDALACRLGVGTRHLNRLFTRHVGASPNSIAQTRRLQFAKRLLDETDLSITQIALAAGYGSVRRFNHCFRTTYRRSPRELRKRKTMAPHGTSKEQVMLRLSYRPPYAWRDVLRFLAERAIPGVEHVDDGSYSRVVRADDKLATVRVTSARNADGLELHVYGAEPSALFPISTTARRVFDLAADPARIVDAFGADPWLGPLVRAWPGIRIVGEWDPFECAVRAIVGRQTDRAEVPKILARIASIAGTRLPVPTAGLTHVFPTARQVCRADLSAVGLTAARAETILALAQAVLAGSIDWSASTENTLAALNAVPGIGSKTAQYVALRALGEPDAFPSAFDVLPQVVGHGGTPLSARALEIRAEAWRPWRGYAAMLAWHSASSARRRRGPSSAMAPSIEVKEIQDVIPGLSRQHQSEDREERR
jgi:AraC family transcriptional regulator, regulatory protein of adaptative response / DNA-3-methyladenine glycosylase II